jgi:hypothetical protein
MPFPRGERFPPTPHRHLLRRETPVARPSRQASWANYVAGADWRESRPNAPTFRRHDLPHLSTVRRRTSRPNLAAGGYSWVRIRKLKLMPVSSLPGLTALRVRPPSGHGTRAVLRRRTRLRGSGCQPLSSCPFCGDLGPRTDRRDVASAASVKGLKSRGRGAKRFRVRHGPERVHRRIAREFRRRARPFGKKLVAQEQGL